MPKTLKNKKGGIFINTLDSITATSIKEKFTNFIENITRVEDITKKIRVTDKIDGIEDDLKKGKYYKIVNNDNNEFIHTDFTLFNTPVKELILKLVVIDDNISENFIEKNKSNRQTIIEYFGKRILDLNKNSREKNKQKLDEKIREEREKLAEKFNTSELPGEMIKLLEQQNKEIKNGNNEIEESSLKELKKEYNINLQKEKEKKEKEHENNADYFMKYRKFNSVKFNNCVEIQKDIFLKTVEYLEPICPAIIYSEILEQEHYENYLNEIFKKSMTNESKKIIKYLNDNKLKLGIIAMENYENYENYFILKNKKKIGNYIYFLCYIYLSLFKLGYVDPYFDANSIIINDNYSYFFDIKGRPLLIDFTTIEKLSHDDNNIINEHIKNETYVAAFEYYCGLATNNPFPSWMCNSFGLSKDEEIDEKFDEKFDEKLNKVIEGNVKVVDENININKKAYKKNENKNIEINNFLKGLFKKREEEIKINIESIKNDESIKNFTYPLTEEYIMEKYRYMLPDNKNRSQGGRKMKKTQKNKKTRKMRKTRKYRI